jgi:hypothetical protein
MSTNLSPHQIPEADIAADQLDRAAKPDAIRRLMVMAEQTEPECCLSCGSTSDHWNDSRGRSRWTGQGETDCCSQCGADYEHWDIECKKPLSGWSLRILLSKARDVEEAYLDVSRPMTREQIVRNREYFRRIVLAMLSSDLYHIEDRAEQTDAIERRERLIEEAADLFAKVYDGRTAKAFYKHCSHAYSESDLHETIASLRCELEPVEPANEPDASGKKFT